MVAALPSVGASSMTTPASALRTYWLLSAASTLTQGRTSLMTCSGRPNKTELSM